jgi:hypothetical protein
VSQCLRTLVNGWEGLHKQRGAVALEYLPAYVPDLNTMRSSRSPLWHHAMPSCCATDFGELKARACRIFRSRQRRSKLVRAFWWQAALF